MDAMLIIDIICICISLIGLWLYNNALILADERNAKVPTYIRVIYNACLIIIAFAVGNIVRYIIYG